MVSDKSRGVIVYEEAHELLKSLPPIVTMRGSSQLNISDL